MRGEASQSFLTILGIVAANAYAIFDWEAEHYDPRCRPPSRAPASAAPTVTSPSSAPAAAGFPRAGLPDGHHVPLNVAPVGATPRGIATGQLGAARDRGWRRCGSGSRPLRRNRVARTPVIPVVSDACPVGTC